MTGRHVLLLFASILSSAHANSITPLGKVIEMMNGMLEKGKAAKHAEEVGFAKFSVWCDTTRRETEASIKDGVNKIEELSTEIDKAVADGNSLTEEIGELETSIAQHKSEADSATALRKKEHADYAATHTDFSESIDAIERAIAVLKARDIKIAQASLLQLQSFPHLPREAKAVINSFLDVSNVADGVPEADAYEFQSDTVVAMLEKLRLKFQDQRLALEKAEINAKSNFQLLLQRLTDNIGAEEQSASEKTAARAGRKEDAAEAKGTLKLTLSSKQEDETKLSDTNAECAAKTDEFQKNQKLREDELVAIQKAVEILSSDAVSGNAATYLPSLAQKATGFAQLRAAARNDSDVRKRAADFLQNRAKELGSRYLALMAARASEDPFSKVKKMIKDLIVKLMEQANTEADHKGFCDTELATNKQTRDIKSAEVDELSAQLDKKTADSEQLTLELKTLVQEISELRAQQAKATEIRGEEKKQNAQTVADAKEAQAAVERAMQILKEFYAQASTAFVQIKSREPYHGMQVGGGNVLSFLDVVLSDFARLESETGVAENEAVRAYQKFMDESNQDLALKETEKKHKEGKKDQTDDLIRSLKKELKLTQEELSTALEYYDKLKPDCVDHALSYEDRVSMREEEIKSLQEALKVLNGQALG